MTSRRPPFVSVVCVRCGRTVRGKDLERIQPLGLDGYACWHCQLIDQAMQALDSITRHPESPSSIRIFAGEAFNSVALKFRSRPSRAKTGRAPWPIDLDAPPFGASMRMAAESAAASVAAAAAGYHIPAGVNPVVQLHVQEMSTGRGPSESEE